MNQFLKQTKIHQQASFFLFISHLYVVIQNFLFYWNFCNRHFVHNTFFHVTDTKYKISKKFEFRSCVVQKTALELTARRSIRTETLTSIRLFWYSSGVRAIRSFEMSTAQTPLDPIGMNSPVRLGIFAVS